MSPHLFQSVPLRSYGRGVWRHRALAAAAIMSLAVVTACSDSDTTTGADGPSSSSSTEQGGGGLTAITVDAPATTAQAAVFLGSQGGEFADAGLNVTVNPHTAADSPLVGLMSGAFPIVWTSAADLLVAQEKGLPVVILAESDLGEPGTAQVIVKEDSPIEELADFAGTSIGIPGPTSSCAVTIPAALKEAGVDPTSVKLTPVALPDQGTALQRGVVDAVCTPDPFLSIIDAQVPSRTMIDTFAAPRSDTLVGVYATTEKYASAHPDVIQDFRAGLLATNKRLNGDPEALRQAIPTFTQVDASLAAKMALPKYSEDVTDPAPVESLLSMMKDASLVDSDELGDHVFAAGS